MKGLSKALSVLLILSAGFGVYNSTASVKDVLDCKEYWEEQGKISDENLDKLDDGVSQLKENEQAYVDGTKTYEDGLATLTSGKAQLADGKQTLADSKQLLADAKTLRESVSNYQALFEANAIMTNYGVALATLLKNPQDQTQGFNDNATAVLGSAGAIGAELANIPDGVSDDLDTLKAAGTSLSGAVAKAPTTPVAAVVGAFNGIYKLSTKLPGAITTSNTALRKQLTFVTEDLTLSNIDGFITIATNYQLTGAVAALTAHKAMLKANAAVTNALTSTIDTTWMNGTVIPAYNKCAPQNQEQLSNLGGGIVGTLLEKGYIEDEEQKAALTPYSSGQAVIDSGAPEVLITFYKDVFPTVLSKLNTKISEGEVQLAAGEKLIAVNEQKIAAGEVELAEGKAKLAEYEDGEAQLSDGLNQLLATETYTGLKSIKNRLGSSFSFLKDNGKNINLTKAATAVKTGREFSADSSVKITNELTTRAVGAGAVIAAALFALIAGFLGLTKKKGATALSVLALVAAAAGIIATNMAGTEMSAAAGSTIAGFSAISGAVVIAVVALVAAIAFKAAKSADVAEVKEA